MKLVIMLLSFLLLFSLASAQENPSVSTVPNVCHDSDNGQNYFVRGIADNRVNGIGSWYEDVCSQVIWSTVNGLPSGQYTVVDSCSGSDCHLFEGFCEGNAVTNHVYDGCALGCKNGACVGEGSTTTPNNHEKESVKCVFKGVNSEQRCWAANMDGEPLGCSGREACVVDLSAAKGTSFTWKSSCGGYAYTKMDGQNEYAVFTCLSTPEVKPADIQGRGFKYAYYQCYNGKEFKSEGDSSCKPSEVWQKYAQEFCGAQCSEDGVKCGVNSFGVSGECYSNEKSTGVVVNPTVVSTTPATTVTAAIPVGEGVESSSEKVPEKVCVDSCSRNDKCYPFGFRNVGDYCSDKGSFVTQLKGETDCENSFECQSNVCVSNQCVSQGLIDRFFVWFKNIFG